MPVVDARFFSLACERGNYTSTSIPDFPYPHLFLQFDFRFPFRAYYHLWRTSSITIPEPYPLPATRLPPPSERTSSHSGLLLAIASLRLRPSLTSAVHINNQFVRCIQIAVGNHHKFLNVTPSPHSTPKKRPFNDPNSSCVPASKSRTVEIDRVVVPTTRLVPSTGPAIIAQPAALTNGRPIPNPSLTLLPNLSERNNCRVSIIRNFDCRRRE
jgi:hypothetical protein